MRQGRRLCVAVVFALLVLTGTAQAQIVVQNGETQPAFGYTDAIRERVFVGADFDSDNNGINDVIAVDIIRPKATDTGLKAPVIMDASPYYSTLGRGNESQLKVDDANGLLAKWPLFLDNYFVPRGYAIALVDMTGTNHSTGCPTVQGMTDNLAAATVIDWFRGRRVGRDKDGNVVAAPAWFNGKTGMIGKSYDGALAAATAVTGVEGLTTIIAESGPYDYYDYTRSNGVIQRGGHYLRSLASTVTDQPRRAACEATYKTLDDGDGDATADFTRPFWSDRNYVDDAANVKASVFLVHGMNDENVRFDHFSRFWYALGELGIPRKARIQQSGHIDPFDVDRPNWVRTAHHWFDYWLQGVQNGIMDEPPVDVETGPSTWEHNASWPSPGSTPTQVFLKPGPNAGTLGLAPEPGAEQTTTFTDSANQSETTMLNNQTTVTANRRVFLSPVLTAPVRISGTPIVQLDASVNKTSTHFGAILVDYGPATTHVSRSGDGATTLTATDCWGDSAAGGPACAKVGDPCTQSAAIENACYKQVGERLESATRWRVTKGILDAGHRTDRRTTTPIVADQRYPFSFPMLPYEYTFQPGHQIAVVIVGSYRDYGSTASNTAAAITLSLQKSRVVLPIVGGGASAKAAGISAGAPTTTALADSGSEFTATVTGNDAALTGQPLPPDLMGEALRPSDMAGFTKLGTPTGAVQFLDGGQPLGNPVPLNGGVAKLSSAGLGGGSHQISARYAGEGAYSTSTSAEVTHLVPVNSTVGGTVPATLSLTLGGPASFGAFTAGLAHEYTAQTTANVVSTAGDATLSVSDPGHMTNGAFSLPQPLQVQIAPASWTGPVSNASVAITFKQAIGANDALRTGSYTKTLTFTLSTTTP
jgi:X-Pro dipeptidyl-peptidase